MRLLRSQKLVWTVLFVVCVGFPIGCGGGGDSNPINNPDPTPSGCTAPLPPHVGVSGGLTGMNATELQMAEHVFAIVNAERAQRGLTTLTWDDDLAKVAYQHSLWQRMVYTGDITHEGPGACNSPSDTQCLDARLAAGGLNELVDYTWRGENVAGNQLTPEQVMCQAWMNSPGHYANIVRPEFNRLGVGVSMGPIGTGTCCSPVWTQVFTRHP